MVEFLDRLAITYPPNNNIHNLENFFMVRRQFQEKNETGMTGGKKFNSLKDKFSNEFSKDTIVNRLKFISKNCRFS